MTEKKATKAKAKKAPAKKKATAPVVEQPSGVIVQSVTVTDLQCSVKCPFCHSMHFHPASELNTTTLSRCDADAKSYFIKEHAR